MLPTPVVKAAGGLHQYNEGNRPRATSRFPVSTTSLVVSVTMSAFERKPGTCQTRLLCELASAAIIRLGPLAWRLAREPVMP